MRLRWHALWQQRITQTHLNTIVMNHLQMLWKQGERCLGVLCCCAALLLMTENLYIITPVPRKSVLPLC